MTLLKRDLKNHILHITLDDSTSRNALSPFMAKELNDCISDPSIQGIWVSALGPTFCSGGNLSYYKSLETPEEGLAENLKITEILKTFSQLPVPTVAFVDGACYGGGLEFLSSFDWVFASPKSLFGMWQRKVGLTFGWGGEPRLSRKMGPGKTMNWLAEGKTLSAYQAKEIGLVDEIGLAGCGEDMAVTKINHVVKWGLESFALSKRSRGMQQNAFEKLWMTGRHKQVLKKF